MICQGYFQAYLVDLRDYYYDSDPFLYFFSQNSDRNKGFFKKSLVCHFSIYCQIRDFVPYFSVPNLEFALYLPELCTDKLGSFLKSGA